MASTDQHSGQTMSIEEGRAHDWVYIKWGIYLAILTAIEVALFYFPPGALEEPALIFLMIVKFIMVAAIFMHLKGDHKILSYLFGVGMVLAVAVYAAVLFASELFF
jgi:cytochrome c oxidase subunit IV